MMMIIFMMV